MLSAATTTMLGLVSSLVMWMGGHLVLKSQWTVGDYFQYNVFLAMMIAPIFQLVNIGTEPPRPLPAWIAPMRSCRNSKRTNPPAALSRCRPLRAMSASRMLSLPTLPRSPSCTASALRQSRGLVTALVGSSGSGKSTIISLVCFFHTPSSGSVLVDGIDLSIVNLNTFRSQLGVVLQDSFLFDGTIRENIMLTRPDATEEQFLFACRTARVDEFAERFPETYETIVGERGVKLSGGQRQRLSIARALLADPRLLILDEATSSLDSESEAMIQAGLQQLMQGRTTFVIAHRLSTIRRADQILVVEEGRIVERGNHAQLYAMNGRYRDLYDRQHGLEANLFLAPGEGDIVPA